MRSLCAILFLSMAVCLALWPDTGAAFPGGPLDAMKALVGGKKKTPGRPAPADPKSWSNADRKKIADQLAYPQGKPGASKPGS